MSIRVVVFSGHYLPGYKGGGPIKTIRNLLHQTNHEISYRLVTKDRDLGDEDPYNTVKVGHWNKLNGDCVFYSQPGLKGIGQILYILLFTGYDIVYLNSFFSIRFSFFPLLICKLLSKRIVLGPRGEFSHGALNIKTKKKNFYLWFYKTFKLYKGVIFQASSIFEAEDIKFALNDTVDVHVAENIGSQEFANSVNSHYSPQLRLVFVSRISPMKNLFGALEILRFVSSNVIYDIYGPIEDRDYWSRCLKIIAALPNNVTVRYRGVLEPQDVVTTMSKYDVFFLPTKGENFGHVIAEALCAGLPLLIADTTPWRNLQSTGLGWDLPLSEPQSFISALEELAALSSHEHLHMREKVLAWAKYKFSQREAIDANIAMFRYAYEKDQ